MNEDINNLLYRIFDDADRVNVSFFIHEWIKLNIHNSKDAKIILKPFIFRTVAELCVSEGYVINASQLNNILNGNLISYTGTFEMLLLIKNIQKAVNYVIDAGISRLPLTSGFVYNVYTIVATGITKCDFDYYKKHMFRSKTVSENMRLLTSDLRKPFDSEIVLDRVSYFLMKMNYIQPFDSFNGIVAKLVSIYYLLYNNCPPILYISSYDDALKDCIINAMTDDELCEVTAILKCLLKDTMTNSINYNNTFNKRIKDYIEMETEYDK